MGDPRTPDETADTSDVVEGPVGSANLKDPDRAAPHAADLEALPTIEPDAAEGSSDHRD